MTSIRVPFALEATPAMGMIDKLVGGMKKLTGSIGKAGVAAIAAGVGIGIFASRYLSNATQEAIKFQTEMIGLRKILGERMAYGIGESIGDLTKDMPLARQELVNVAETAARLGVRGTSNIISFTRTMAMMGVATNVSAETAADALARVAKQTGLPISKLENLGSVINELSNTMATSASEIIDSVRRSAPELARLGVPAEDIAAMAATLNTVSESATRAGTRLRRLGQALSDPNKIEVFAAALEKTPGAIRRMREEDPTGLILQIVDAMAKGGAAADRLAAGLDARVRLALAALAQVQGDLNIALATGRDEMENNNSLIDEYSRILNTVVAKQQLLTNRITETRREIGENMLPVMSMWLDFLNNIASKINFIINRPLEGMIEDETLDRLEEASLKLKKNAENLEELQQLASLKGDIAFTGFIDEKQAKMFRLEIETLTASVGVFGRDFARAAVEVVERNAAMGSTLEHTRNEVHGLSLAFTRMDAVAEGNARLTVEIDKALAGLRGQLRRGEIDIVTYIQKINDMSQSLSWAKLRSQELIAAEEALAASLPTAAMGDFEQELKDEILQLTATEAQLLRLSPAYLEATEAIATMKATGEGNTEALEAWVEGVDELIDRVVGLRGETEKLTEAEKAYQKALKDIKKEAESEAERLKGRLAALKEEYILLTQGEEAAQRFRYEQEFSNDAWVNMLMLIWKVNNALKGYNEAQDEAARREKSVQDRIQRRMDLMDFANVETRFRMLERVIDGVTDAAIEFFESLVTGSGNAKEAIINMIRAIVEEFLRAQIMKQLLKWLGPAGMDLFNVGSAMSTDTPEVTAAAKGGYLTKNQLAIVGERGPELFVPDVGGTVVPNNKLDQLGGEPIVVNHNFTVNAIDSAGVREMLAREQDFIAGLSIDTINRHRILKR